MAVEQNKLSGCEQVDKTLQNPSGKRHFETLPQCPAYFGPWLSYPMWTHVEFDPHGDPTVFHPPGASTFSVTAPLWQGSRLTEQPEVPPQSRSEIKFLEVRLKPIRTLGSGCATVLDFDALAAPSWDLFNLTETYKDNQPDIDLATRCDVTSKKASPSRIPTSPTSAAYTTYTTYTRCNNME